MIISRALGHIFVAGPHQPAARSRQEAAAISTAATQYGSVALVTAHAGCDLQVLCFA
jgi:hypothetical protein